jgi:hypothetical protein
MPAKTQLKQTERTVDSDRRNLELAISGINKQFGAGCPHALG